MNFLRLLSSGLLLLSDMVGDVKSILSRGLLSSVAWCYRVVSHYVHQIRASAFYSTRHRFRGLIVHNLRGQVKYLNKYRSPFHYFMSNRNPGKYTPRIRVRGAYNGG